MKSMATSFGVSIDFID